MFKFLLIEFFDELNYAINGAVLPALRSDLELSYAQIGLLLGLPTILSVFIEPVLMLLGDTRLRRLLVVGGGVLILVSLLLLAGAQSFWMVLAAMILSYPASGAFVSLSQATLMDLNPGREPHAMARWTVAGSWGNLIGPLVVAGGFALALGWRWLFVALAGMALALVLAVLRQPAAQAGSAGSTGAEASAATGPDAADATPRALWRNLLAGLRNRRLLRWILLLQLSDLLLDVLSGYVPLYFTDVAGLTPAQASLVFGLFMLTSLAVDLVTIPLLERIPGRRLVRVSAALAVGFYIAWLLAPWPLAKIGLLVLVRAATIGWYQVLQGEAYASAPGRSGTVMALGSLGGLLGGALVWATGWIANQAGLTVAMWLLLAGPVGLVLLVPKTQEPENQDHETREPEPQAPVTG